MIKVKTFYCEDTDELEKKVNEFLASIPKFQLIDIKMCYNENFYRYIAMVIYKEY